MYLLSKQYRQKINDNYTNNLIKKFNEIDEEYERIYSSVTIQSYCDYEQLENVS